mgnify:CR=1 FL=1
MSTMKPITARSITQITFLSLLLAITGCNSSSDNDTSSGGGGGSTSTTTTPTTPTTPPETSVSFAGTYTGTATATASALGLTESETAPVTIIIDQNGRVTVQSDADIFPDVIALNGNTFATSQTFNDEKFGSATCSGTLSLQGSIDNSGLLTATLSSQSVSCNSIPGTVTGSLQANRQG